MRTPRSILAFGAATVLVTALAAGCTPAPPDPTPTTTTTTTTIPPVTGACHRSLPDRPGPDWYYTGTPNVFHNLWYTESVDGSCTGPVHFDIDYGGFVRFDIMGLASDVPVGASAGETAYANCLVMGGNFLESHPLDQSVAGFTPQDYYCLLRVV